MITTIYNGSRDTYVRRPIPLTRYSGPSSELVVRNRWGSIMSGHRRFIFKNQCEQQICTRKGDKNFNVSRQTIGSFNYAQDVPYPRLYSEFRLPHPQLTMTPHRKSRGVLEVRALAFFS